MSRIKELRKVVGDKLRESITAAEKRGENSEHLACQRRSRILAKTHDMEG